MIRKHFVIIAESIRLQYKWAEPDERHAIRTLVEKTLCPSFKECNIHFDSEKFLAACGLSDV